MGCCEVRTASHIPHCPLPAGDVAKLSHDGVVLKSGEGLAAGVLLHCTPATRSYHIFDADLQVGRRARPPGGREARRGCCGCGAGVTGRRRAHPLAPCSAQLTERGLPGLLLKFATRLSHSLTHAG